MGYTTAFAIRIKILQEIWEQGLEWDEEFGDILRLKWEKWYKEVNVLKELSLPRYYFHEEDSCSEVGNYKIIIFCDANPTNWKYIKVNDNPADIISRGCSANDLLSSAIIINGPTWLTLSEEKWLKNEENFKRADVDEEKRSKFIAVNYAKELEEAENLLLRHVQAKNYSKDIDCLKEGQHLQKCSKIRDLNPFISDKGIILVGGRLQHSNLNYYEKHPILLPSKTKFTELIVKEAHEKTLHSGVSNTLTQVREKFLIPKGRQFIKSVIGSCVLCKRFNVRSGSEIMAPLPKDRIEQSPPFSVTGLDFAEPLFVKDSD
ncbi:uncharacterized protein, partial [Parasteatoda tepidariorum]|uniref:uncharacterized protein n=1 Tax=Parasteatoda tepidariorum TaxID=114398 RepID=UPI0039BC7B9E